MHRVVFNQKGGVGKTHHLQPRGDRRQPGVANLVIDLDVQHNSTLLVMKWMPSSTLRRPGCRGCSSRLWVREKCAKTPMPLSGKPSKTCFYAFQSVPR